MQNQPLTGTIRSGVKARKRKYPMRENEPDSSPVHCIGKNGTDGCGYTGGISGETCPKCNGMLLSDRSIKVADRLALKLIKKITAK